MASHMGYFYTGSPHRSSWWQAYSLGFERGVEHGDTLRAMLDQTVPDMDYRAYRAGVEAGARRLAVIEEAMPFGCIVVP